MAKAECQRHSKGIPSLEWLVLMDIKLRSSMTAMLLDEQWNIYNQSNQLKNNDQQGVQMDLTCWTNKLDTFRHAFSRAN